MKLLIKVMKQRLFYGMAALVCGMFLFVSSCVKDELDFKKFGGVNYNGDFAIPLVHSQLSFKDLLSSVDTGNLLVDDSTQGLSIVYSSRVFSQTADEIFIIPNQDFTSPSVDYIMPPVSNGDSTIAVPVDMSFEFDSLNNAEQIDSIYVKSGQYRLELSSDIDHDGLITIEIGSVYKNGKPLKFNLDYSYNRFTTRGSVSNVIDLTGCKIALNNAGGKRNEFDITASVKIYGDDHSSIGGNYSLTFNHKLSNIRYNKMFGYLGQRVFNMALGTVDVNIFKNNIMGGVTLDDPRLIITSTNSFGIPLEVRVDTFRSLSNNSGATDITSTLWPYSVSAPGYSSSIITPEVSVMTLNNSTTNNTLSNAVKTSPQTVIYKVSSKTNPTGLGRNFVLSDSRFDVDVMVDLPLAGTMSGYVMQDTLPYTMENLDQVDYIEFRTIVDNWFPVDAVFQIYFLDENYKKLDSLFTKEQAVISGGLPDPAKNNRVTQARHLMTDTRIPSEVLKKSVGSKYMLIKSTMSTTKVNGVQPSVKFYSDYIMDVKLSTRAKLKANL